MWASYFFYEKIERWAIRNISLAKEQYSVSHEFTNFILLWAPPINEQTLWQSNMMSPGGLAVPPRVVGGLQRCIGGTMHFCLLFFLWKKEGLAAGDVALAELLLYINLLLQWCKVVSSQVLFFIFLVENEAKNKNEQTKAFPQAILPAFVHPFAQENQVVLKGSNPYCS